MALTYRLDGLQAVCRLGCDLGTKIVFLTIHEDQDFVHAAFAVRAFGYVAKADITSDLPYAIFEVVEGHQFISRSISA